MNHRLISYVLALFILATGVGAVVYWEWPGILTPGARPAEATPAINWTPSSLGGEVARGHSKTIVVSFISSETVSNVEVRVVPALQSLVKVNPSTFVIITKGQRLTLNVTFSASNSSPLGTFDGTIQLRKGNTLAKPLPVTILVTIVPLPPDPGSAGKQTLAGIDSDGDGVRDDVQRYIALTYPNSARTRAALTQVAKAVQTALLDASDKQASIKDAAAQLSAVTCLDYVLGTTSAREALSNLLAPMLNTAVRSHAFIVANEQLGGQVFESPPLTAWKSLCTFDPDSLEN